ncbi:MAG: hypothetical protein RLZ44_606 [Pseudomonadota bacterium]|jgi:hypothetical protein
MALNSYDSLMASIAAGKAQEIFFNKAVTQNSAGQAASLWTEDAYPAAGGYGTSLNARNCGNTTTGGLFFGNPSGTDSLYLVAGEVVPSASSIGSLMLYDRLADISGIDMTTLAAQNFSMSALPRYATGAGVQMFLEVTTTISGTPPVFTINYTNQGGTASRTTGAVTCAANSANRLAYSGSIYIPLQSGDSGVRTAQSITLSVAASAGVCALVFARPLVSLPLLTAGAVVERDFVTQVPRMPPLEDNHCLALLTYGTGSTTGSLNGRFSAIAG